MLMTSVFFQNVYTNNSTILGCLMVSLMCRSVKWKTSKITSHYSDVIEAILENLDICTYGLMSPASTHIPCFDQKYMCYKTT